MLLPVLFQSFHYFRLFSEVLQFVSAISRRKLEMPVEAVINAINTFDLKQLSLENVELLQRMVPTEQETKAYREYVIEKKNVNLLTEEDKFLMHLTKVERIQAKLSIMNYIGNFFDNIHLITPVNLFFMHEISKIKLNNF